MKNATFTFVAFCLLEVGSLSLQAQPLGKSPGFLQDFKPNFFKMQKKGDKLFKNYVAQHREEEDSTEEGQELGFEPGYNRPEDKEYHRFKRWEWFWRDRV